MHQSRQVSITYCKSHIINHKSHIISDVPVYIQQLFLLYEKL